jgi:hypothetical protein
LYTKYWILYTILAACVKYLYKKNTAFQLGLRAKNKIYLILVAIQLVQLPSLYLAAPLERKGCGFCQVFDKPGTIAPEGAIIGYCILDTVYNGISIKVPFCQEENLDVRHLK